MENLKALVYKGDLTPYQKALAQREFEGMIERLEIFEKAVKNNAVLPLVVCSNCPKVIGLTVGKSYTQLAKHKDTIALVNDYGDLKRYNIAYFE